MPDIFNCGRVSSTGPAARVAADRSKCLQKYAACVSPVWKFIHLDKPQCWARRGQPNKGGSEVSLARLVNAMSAEHRMNPRVLPTLSRLSCGGKPCRAKKDVP